MATIPLRDVEGADVEAAYVDDEDFDRINAHRWSLMGGVARRSIRLGTKVHTVLMHREVMGCTFGDGLKVEHVSNNLLDNRKANLRVRPATTPAPRPRMRAPVAAGAFGDTWEAEP